MPLLVLISVAARDLILAWRGERGFGFALLTTQREGVCVWDASVRTTGGAGVVRTTSVSLQGGGQLSVAVHLAAASILFVVVPLHNLSPSALCLVLACGRCPCPLIVASLSLLAEPLPGVALVAGRDIPRAIGFQLCPTRAPEGFASAPVRLRHCGALGSYLTRSRRPCVRSGGPEEIIHPLRCRATCIR